MGKSSKKSTPKLDGSPALTVVSKSGKKGKREAEQSIEKLANVKKQKIHKESQKKKLEIKTQKKNKEESRNSDGSSSEEEEQVKVMNKVARKAPVKESSGEESSSSEEETTTKASAPKNSPLVATKNKAESSDISESDDSDSDESSDDDKETPAKAQSAKKVPAAASKNKADSDDSSDDSDSSSDEEEVAPAKASAFKKVPAVPVIKVETSDSSDESDSEESSDDNKEEAKVPVGSKRPSSAQPIDRKKAKAMFQEESSDEETSDHGSDDEEASEDEKPAKTPKKKDTDVEMVDAVTQLTTTNQGDFILKRAPQTPLTPDAGSKTLFVGNLPYHVERADIENFFKGAGEIVDVRFSFDMEQRFKGYVHVEFATVKAAQKALGLNGQSLGGREVRLDIARERGAKGERGADTPYNSKVNNSFRKEERGEAQQIFVRGFDKSLGEDEIRSSLQEHFGTCGEITRISIPPDYETGAVKGIAYLEFKDADAFNKALELGGSQLGDHYLTVEEARPRGDSRDGWSGGRRGGRDSGGRRGGRDGGGRFGGRRGGRGGGGRGRGTPNKPGVTAAASGKKTTFNDDDE